MPVLSFVFLDDLSPCYGPVHRELENLSELAKAIEEIHDDFSKNWHCNEYYDMHYDQDQVIGNLMRNGYCVYNRLEKYYVAAYALDYTRFEVYSKDCDKKVIDWGIEESKQGPIKGIITDPEYNLNPVIKFMRSLN